MSRPLVPGLVAEGETDEVFLGVVISRQLREITVQSSRCAVDVESTEIGSGRSIYDHDRTAGALRELAGDCHLLFVHNDHRERDKAERVVRDSGLSTPVIALVPVQETEAWLLADAGVWRRLSGSDHGRMPARPRDVERIADPKKVLAEVAPRRGKPVRDYFEYIARNIDLATLAKVPAYAEWVVDARNALKGLGYL
ncbi:DUF4276 family protein [Microbispora sp. H10949]|uniref:DUF4276 family protein n=1 Tax=Microbispora sp. H10949 TaxID=2729111 RepID=UPI0016002A0C|nr:DUF4276 family protein [Microbispora sp. H10949]